MQILLELLLEKRKPVHAEEHMKPSFKAMKLNKSSNSGYLPSLILEQSFKGCTKEQTLVLPCWIMISRKEKHKFLRWISGRPPNSCVSTYVFLFFSWVLKVGRTTVAYCSVEKVKKRWISGRPPNLDLAVFAGLSTYLMLQCRIAYLEQTFFGHPLISYISNWTEISCIWKI